MKYFYTLLATLLLLPALTFAQSNFKPGYIVNLRGDTVRGFVDYQEWEASPVTFNFKGADNKITKLNVQNTATVVINDLESFRRYSGPISQDETNENRILNGRDTSFITADVFVKILQEGNVINLYAYTDAIKTRFLYSTPSDSRIRELVYRIYYDNNKVNQSRGRTVTDNTYTQQLSAIALAANVLDDKLQTLMDKADYTPSSLLKIVSKMNGIKRVRYSVADADNSSNFDLYAGLGINATTTNAHGNYQKAGGTSYTSYLPKALFGFNAYANPVTRRLMFSAEISVAMSKYKSLYENKIYPYVGIDYRFSQVTLSLTPYITYHFYNGENLKVFGAMGININKFSFSNVRYQGQDGSNVNYGAYPAWFRTRSNAALYKVGALIRKRFQVYASYTTVDDISYDDFFYLTQNHVHIGVNYLLAKQK